MLLTSPVHTDVFCRDLIGESFGLIEVSQLKKKHVMTCRLRRREHHFLSILRASLDITVLVEAQGLIPEDSQRLESGGKSVNFGCKLVVFYFPDMILAMLKAN